MDYQITFEGFGLAGRIVFDAKILQLHGERQFLHQITVTHVQKHDIADAVLRQGDAAAKRPVITGFETADLRHIPGGEIALFDPDITQPFAKRQAEIAVHHKTDTDHHHPDMGKQITQAIKAAFHKGDNGTVLAGSSATAITLVAQVTGKSLFRLPGGFVNLPLTEVAHHAQGFLLH